MIISASYRTDIPAFYSQWFINRFRAGYAKVPNPYGSQISTVPLRAKVDGFVFWTRNIQPFFPALTLVRQAEIPFVVTHTVTGYPRRLERSVVPSSHAVAAMARVADRFGPRVVVWRYDPIVLSDLTPLSFHQDQMDRLARSLAGITDEICVSFLTPYHKTRRGLDRAVGGDGWADPPDQDKRALLSALVPVAAAHGMTLGICSQDHLRVSGVAAAACIDARRLEDVGRGWGNSRPIAAKVKGNRPGCRCHESRDIGEYDTCPHGCAYCYAVRGRDVAVRRHAHHDPAGEFLIPPADCPPSPALLF